MRPQVVATLVCVSFFVKVSQAQTPSPLEICQSSVSGFTTEISVQSMPTEPIDAVIVPGTHSKFEITCIKIHEKGPVLAASQVGLCSTPALIYICTAPASGPTTWTCNPHEAYQKDPHSHVMIGGQDTEAKHIKVQWAPQGSGILCFPRDLTAQMVGAAIVPPKSNLAANIAFIGIVVIVLLLVGIFVFYQFRKVMRKWWKKSKARPATHMTTAEHHNTVKALGGDPNAKADGTDKRNGVGNRGITRMDIYDGKGGDGEGEDGSGGEVIAVIDGGTVEIKSHAMPKPWFKRFNYDGNTENPGEVDSREGSAGRRDDQMMRGMSNSPSSMRNYPYGKKVESINREDDYTYNSSGATPQGKGQNSSSYVEGTSGGRSGNPNPYGGTPVGRNNDRGPSSGGNGGNFPPTSSMYYQSIRQQPARPAGSYYAAHTQPVVTSPDVRQPPNKYGYQ